MSELEKFNELLKKITGNIENIHDNYASLKNLERQKEIAEGSASDTIDEQMEEIKKILENNQKHAQATLEEVLNFAEQMEPPVKNDCQKLQNDFQAHKDNPNLMEIQKDIDQIKKDLKKSI